MSIETERVANRSLTVGGVTKTYAEWAKPLGISPVTLKERICRRKMAAEDAVRMKKSRGRGIVIPTTNGVASAKQYYDWGTWK